MGRKNETFFLLDYSDSGFSFPEWGGLSMTWDYVAATSLKQSGAFPYLIFLESRCHLAP